MKLLFLKSAGLDNDNLILRTMSECQKSLKISADFLLDVRVTEILIIGFNRTLLIRNMDLSKETILDKSLLYPHERDDQRCANFNHFLIRSNNILKSMKCTRKTKKTFVQKLLNCRTS